MLHNDTQSSIVAATMREIGSEGHRHHSIDNLVPLALSEGTDVLTKRLILLLITTRNNPDLNDLATLEQIVAAIAKQDPTAAFAALFQAYDRSLDNRKNFILPKGSPDYTLPQDEFLFKNAIPLVSRLPEKDLPFCSAFVFDSVAWADRDSPPENLPWLAHLMLDRLEQSFPGETQRLLDHLNSDPPVNPMVPRIFADRNKPPTRVDPATRRARNDGEPEA